MGTTDALRTTSRVHSPWRRSRRSIGLSLKRRLSNIVSARTVADQNRRHRALHVGEVTSPGGHRGNDSDSSATGSQPHNRLFGQATPGPVTTERRTPIPALSRSIGSMTVRRTYDAFASRATLEWRA